MNVINACLIASLLAATPGLADPKVEKAILQDIMNNTTVTAKEVKNDAVSKCFSGALYAAKIETRDSPNSSMTQDALYLKVAEDFIKLSEPGTNAEMPDLLGIVNAEFKLQSKEDGETMLKALKVLFESTFDDDVKPRVLQDGTTWSLIVGEFFDDFSGFVFETDADGKVIKVSRSLDIKG